MAKIDLADFVKYGKLFEVYGKLLSEDRQALMNLYINFNMTLAEISKEKNISRQAVLDGITKSCAKLDALEEVLSIALKKENLQQKLTKLKEISSVEEIKIKVDEILGDL